VDNKQNFYLGMQARDKGTYYTRLQLGNWAFCVAGPVTWNSLPLHIRSVPTLSTFKNMLKTHLF